MSNGPRALRDSERSLILSVLPEDRSGYRAYRERIAVMVVIGEGRRGPGNFILGHAGETPDLSGPMAPVIAYGGSETPDGSVTVTVREEFGGQIEVEIVTSHGEPVADRPEGGRHWTYSNWMPGLPAPATGAAVREVMVRPGLTLAISTGERRVWVHDASTGFVHLLPVTSFYTELMAHLRIRDPRRALAPGLLFADLDQFVDEALRAAFRSVNSIRHRVDVWETINEPVPFPRTSIWKRLFHRKS